MFTMSLKNLCCFIYQLFVEPPRYRFCVILEESNTCMLSVISTFAFRVLIKAKGSRTYAEPTVL